MLAMAVIVSVISPNAASGQPRGSVYGVRLVVDRAIAPDIAVEVDMRDMTRPILRLDERRVHPNEVAAALAIVERVLLDSSARTPPSLRIARREQTSTSKRIDPRGERMVRMLTNEISRRSATGDTALSILVVTRTQANRGRFVDSSRQGVQPQR
jgi:hypothetical protein